MDIQMNATFEGFKFEHSEASFSELLFHWDLKHET